MTDPERREVIDPDGRSVVFDAGTRLHLAMGRPDLLDHGDAIRATIEAPDHREPHPRPGRECFYRQDLEPRRWLRVVVDFYESPAWVVTALVQDNPPRGCRRRSRDRCCRARPRRRRRLARARRSRRCPQVSGPPPAVMLWCAPAMGSAFVSSTKLMTVLGQDLPSDHQDTRLSDASPDHEGEIHRRCREGNPVVEPTEEAGHDFIGIHSETGSGSDICSPL
jgi:hypothetical protein